MNKLQRFSLAQMFLDCFRNLLVGKASNDAEVAPEPDPRLAKAVLWTLEVHFEGIRH